METDLWEHSSNARQEDWLVEKWGRRLLSSSSSQILLIHTSDDCPHTVLLQYGDIFLLNGSSFTFIIRTNVHINVCTYHHILWLIPTRDNTHLQEQLHPHCYRPFQSPLSFVPIATFPHLCVCVKDITRRRWQSILRWPWFHEAKLWNLVNQHHNFFAFNLPNHSLNSQLLFSLFSTKLGLKTLNLFPTH